MDPFTSIVIVLLVVLFAGLSLLPTVYSDADGDLLVETRD